MLAITNTHPRNIVKARQLRPSRTHSFRLRIFQHHSAADRQDNRYPRRGARLDNAMQRQGRNRPRQRHRHAIAS